MADRIAPISLPAGSFDVEALRANLDKAVSAKNVETHPERINQAIVDSASDTTKEVLAGQNKPAIPEHAEIVRQGSGDAAVDVMSFKPAIDPDTGKKAESGSRAAEIQYPTAAEEAAASSAEAEQPTPVVELAEEAIVSEAEAEKK